MKNLKMFCTSLEPNHLNLISELGYIPVGLGEKNFDKSWYTDKSGDNISRKNKYYAECTYHYWLWKNYLNKIDDGWIGFCHYRKFWSNGTNQNNKIDLQNIKTQVLKEIPTKYDDYEAILGEPFFVNQFKGMKFLKKGIKIIIKNPILFFNKEKRNLKFHFDLMHGEGNLDKAINLLDEDNRKDFKVFVNTKTSFNPFHMFICQNRNKIKDYYNVLFPWLEKCESLFGYDNSYRDGY